jgi:hypothetical protein
LIILFREECKVWNSSLCSFLLPPTSSILIDPNILPSSLFSNTFSPYRTLNVTAHDHILFLYLLLDQRQYWLLSVFLCPYFVE